MTSIRACIQHALIFFLPIRIPEGSTPPGRTINKPDRGISDFRFQLENGLPLLPKEKILYIIKYLNTTPYPEKLTEI